METNAPNISASYTSNSILNHIIDCANAALQSEDAFQKSTSSLTSELRIIFDSEYCSIGIVFDGYAEDCVISYEKFEDEELSKQQDEFLLSVKRVIIDDNDSWIVVRALKSDNSLTWFQQESLNEYGNYYRYKTGILPSREVRNSCIIPLRDKEKKNFGFIQFINTKQNIDYQRDISPYSDALLGLVQIIINNRKNQQELIRRDNRLKDADFYNFMQDKRDNVDDLLDSIMEYFSKEFNAAIVSFRIPLLNSYNKEPLFYLRRLFVHPSIEKKDELYKHYYTERFVKNNTEMYCVDQLRCDNQERILESISDTDFSIYDLNLDNNTLIIPIFRDFDDKCINPQFSRFAYCKHEEHYECKYRFKRLYGIFRVRISRTELTNRSVNYHFDTNETRIRLSYLPKQITFLFNSIVEKHENESLKIFQNELKHSSFTRIKDFDERCVEIIKESVHAKVCSIYRYDERTKLLSLNATTAKSIHFVQMNEALDTYSVIENSCYVHINDKTNILTRVFEAKHTECILNMRDKSIHESHFIELIENEQKINNQSAMIVPMLKKDGTCAGIVLLLGKEEHKHSISTAYWDHDINHIEFIVNMLTRMSESDSERLTFLAQLSHELLAPVIELVNDNDLVVKRWNRKPDLFSKEFLINKLCENTDRGILLKYIICDTELIYSSTSKNNHQYNIVRQEKPQQILLDAIRLLEKEAHYKGLKILTFISKMPPLYFDKERMMQVFLNLFKNAIRYSDNNTKIIIAYGNSGNYHEICISNYGIGITRGEEETIFELFHRGKEAKKKFIRGTGMGLYIVRDIMRAHGGDCFVRRLNNPTEFVITLPIKEYN